VINQPGTQQGLKSYDGSVRHTFETLTVVTTAVTPAAPAIHFSIVTRPFEETDRVVVVINLDVTEGLT
jgi:hypothetical protein